MAGFGALPPGAPARPAPSAGMMDLQAKVRQAPPGATPPPLGAKGPPPPMPMGRPGQGAQMGPPPGAQQARMAQAQAAMKQKMAGAGPMAGPPQMGARPTAPIQRPMTPPPPAMAGGAFGMKAPPPRQGGAFGVPSKAPTAMGQASPFAGSRGIR